MDKPISLRIMEAKNKMAAAANSCDLPPCLLKPIVDELSAQVNAMCEQEIKHDSAAYKESMGDANGNSNNDVVSIVGPEESVSPSSKDS